MTLGLVLGAGGVVGINYHAGVVHALSEVGGIDPAAAEVVVGTSAGGFIGALLRSGWTPKDCWEWSIGTHPSLAEIDPAERERQRNAVFTPGFTSPVDLARRTVGSAYVLSRSFLRVRPNGPRLPKPMARSVMHSLGNLFPAGLFSLGDAREQFAGVLPEAWPERQLWLVAVDIGSGRRIVLGREGTPPVSLHDGVLASCAIPGVYPPVRAGGMTMVDGGAHSTTNLDLASRAGCDVIIGVAPMAYESSTRPGATTVMGRRVAAAALLSEMREARHRGARVLLVRPTATELALHGRRLMRPAEPTLIARAAYEATARLLDTDRARSVLEDTAA